MIEAGRELFVRRQGQLNLACSQCHEDNAGKPFPYADMVERASQFGRATGVRMMGAKPYQVVVTGLPCAPSPRTGSPRSAR